MSEETPIPVSHRAVYHMRQEILRLLEVARAESEGPLSDRVLEELAAEWSRKYRTMRPEAACALIGKLAEEAAPEPGRFAVFVLEGLERRFGPALWATIEALAAGIEDGTLARLVARRAAAPLIARHPELLVALAEAAEPPSSRAAFLLAEARAALRVTDPALADRVDALLARD